MGCNLISFLYVYKNGYLISIMKVENKRCLNCGNIVDDNYCSKCGQSIHTSRIKTSHILEELQYGLFHINRGLLYTLKELFVHPGETVKNYISGRRAKYTKPFIFLLFAGVIYSLIFHFFHYLPMEEMNKHDGAIFEYIPIYDWYSANYSLTVLLLIPFYSLSTYWLFYNRGCNYAEHLVLFSYLNGAKIFFLLLMYPVIYLTKSSSIYHISLIISEIYLVWGLAQFFKSTSWIKVILKVILSLFVAVIEMLLLVFLVFLILQYYDFKL